LSAFFRHDFLYMGRFLNLLLSDLKFESMTAIASVYTPEGFVIGADGRQTDENGTISDDSITKLFGCRAANIRAIFSWTGCASLQGNGDTFDFKDHSLDVLKQLKDEEFNTMADFLTAFSLGFYERLLSWVSESGCEFRHQDDPRWARLQMLGFVDATPAIAEAHFPFLRGLPMKPGLVTGLDRPSAHLTIFAGSRLAYDMMRAEGSMIPCESLESGRELIDRYIQVCSECNGSGSPNRIGGKIHIAAITPLSCHWLVAPPI
jgi:hypothetical protein